MTSCQKKYSDSIGDWLKKAKPFASSESLEEQHQKIQQSIKINLTNQLMGPDEFLMPLIMQFQDVKYNKDLLYMFFYFLIEKQQHISIPHSSQKTTY